MKKLALLCVFSFFATIWVNAQVTKSQEEGPFYHCIPVPCIEEMLCGEVHICHTVWFIPTFPFPVKHSAKVKGELADSEGNVYTFKQVINDRNWGVPNLVGADRATSTWTANLKLDGKPFAVVHFTVHTTWNTNGDVITAFGKVVANCH